MWMMFSPADRIQRYFGSEVVPKPRFVISHQYQCMQVYISLYFPSIGVMWVILWKDLTMEIPYKYHTNTVHTNAIH